MKVSLTGEGDGQGVGMGLFSVVFESSDSGARLQVGHPPAVTLGSHLTSLCFSFFPCRVFFFFFFLRFIYLLVYLFLAALGLGCCTRAFSSCGEWGQL